MTSRVTEVPDIGNTKISVTTSKTWEITINNPTENDINWIQNLEIQKICVTEEIGELNTKHLQGQITFKRAYRLSGVKKLHPRAHWEITKCKKDANYALKVDSKIIRLEDASKQGKRTDLEKIIKECNSIKEVKENHPEIYCRYRNGLNDIFADKEKDRNFKPKVIWIFGKSGSGKTKYIFDRHDPADIWMAPDDIKYFNGYENQKVAVFDDFRGHCKFNEFLRILDRYPMTANVKGTYKKFNSEIIYVTSIRHPSLTWKFLDEDEEPMEQLMRRIDEIIML